MDPRIIEAIIPAVAIVVTFGMPVAIVFVLKWFKLRERELEADKELRKQFGEEQRRSMEARLRSVELIVSAHDAQLQQRTPPGQMRGTSLEERLALMEPPNAPASPDAPGVPSRDPQRR